MNNVLTIAVIFNGFRPVRAKSMFREVDVRLFLYCGALACRAIRKVRKTIEVEVAMLGAVARLRVHPLRREFAMARVDANIVILKEVRVVLVLVYSLMILQHEFATRRMVRIQGTIKHVIK